MNNRDIRARVKQRLVLVLPADSKMLVWCFTENFEDLTAAGGVADAVTDNLDAIPYEYLRARPMRHELPFSIRGVSSLTGYERAADLGNLSRCDTLNVPRAGPGPATRTLFA
jgi:hypothetical protein